MKDLLDQIQKDLELKGANLEHSIILFLDLSSTCTGYCIAAVDFIKKRADFKSIGAIWFNDKWTHQEKYHYIFKALTTYFDIVCKVDYCVMEAYSLNPKKRQGCLVTPEMHGAVQVALAEVGTKYSIITPQQWRKLLNIKRDKETKDYKEPTKQKILEYLSIPNVLKSNISGNDRITPYDVYDALGIALGFLKNLNFDQFTFNNVIFQEHTKYINYYTESTN